MRIAILSALIAVAMGLTSHTPVAATGCGIKPIRPIPPIGCRTFEAECVCDERAEKCAWQWKCVK